MTESITPDTQRAWVDVDLDALVANARAFHSLVRAPLLPMVKADGYGLGAVAVARALERVDPWGYGVATVGEGAVLRQAAIGRPILVFSPLLPDAVAGCLSEDLRPCLGDLAAVEAWIARSAAPFHLEIDTGMRRSGIPWDDAESLSRVADLVAMAPGWEGIFTHFHSAETDIAATRLQWARLHEVIAALGLRPRFVHAANSGAGVADLGLGADLARPGIYLYGGRVAGHTPHPVAALRGRVVALRRIARGDTVSYGATWAAEHATTIATVAFGYGDGLPRSLSNVGRIELDGATHPVAGRVTMDLTMVDVGEAPIRIGDVATAFGGLISLDDQANAAGTIGYELLTDLNARVVRRYWTGGQVR